MKLETLGYHKGDDQESLSHLALNPYRVVPDGQTDRRTDRIPIANTRSQQYLALPAGTADTLKNAKRLSQTTSIGVKNTFCRVVQTSESKTARFCQES